MLTESAGFRRDEGAELEVLAAARYQLAVQSVGRHRPHLSRIVDREQGHWGSVTGKLTCFQYLLKPYVFPVTSPSHQSSRGVHVKSMYHVPICTTSSCSPCLQRKYHGYKIHFAPQRYAPTASISGRKPSFKLLSSLLISSTELAFAIASFTRCTSSFDIKRPALPGSTTALGSSVVTGALLCVDTVVSRVVAS